MTPATFVTGRTLIVTGTILNDDIRFVPITNHRFVVLLNNFTQGTFSTGAINRVEVRGLLGNDLLDGSRSLVPVVLRGGGGNDLLVDSRFSDILEGSTGGDTLTSTSGRDVLFGGQGTDVLDSRGAGAVMMGGTSTLSIAATENVRRIWNSSQGYRARVDALMQTTGILSQTHDDGSIDVLSGSFRTPDWFLQGRRDRLSDVASGEIITPLRSG